jgi:hypothetical protein
MWTSVAAGILLGVLYTLSPLMVWALVASAMLLHGAGRGLPASESRLLVTTLAAALGLRLVAIGMLVVAGAWRHADPTLGFTLTGDEEYVLSRALRTRDIALGMAVSKFDYFVAFDEYGRSSYVTLLTWIQGIFGPTPYAMRLLNAVIFSAAAVLLVRTARLIVGWPAAYVALLIILFYPTLFVWSISLLKEPLYLLGTALLLASAIAVVRARGWRFRALGGAGVLLALAVVADLRPGAIAIAVSGVAVAVALRLIMVSAIRLAAAAAITIAVVVAMPSVQRRADAALERTAKQQMGHVFTVGHAYKTLDESYYVIPQKPSAASLSLTAGEAARYVVRSAIAFVIVPAPWHIISWRELAYLPEQFAWYALMLLAPFGLAAAWRSDPTASALLVGAIAPTAVALALTNGNVGTLLRLRGVLVPYLAILSALGGCEALEFLAASTRGDRSVP